jgi:CRP/FNR family cyclic AMP-dependent transcriptional regulator
MTTKLDMFRNTSNPVNFKAGETIFTEGEPFDTVYVVLDGEVSIVMDGNELVILGEGELFGEIALLNGGGRSATAVAVTDVELAPISAAQFNFLIDNNRIFAKKIMNVLSERLLRSNQAGQTEAEAEES